VEIGRVSRASLAAKIVEQLRREILAGRLRPGERLPPERELALVLGTNRNTLREAIRSLETMGLVHARQGDGVSVLDFRTTGQIDLLGPLLAAGLEPNSLRRVLGEILRFRRVALAEAAALAAERASAEESARLAGVLARIRASLGDRAALVSLDLEFFRVLTEISGSLVARLLFNTFVRVYEDLIRERPELFVCPEGYPESLAAVAAAIAGGRPDEARRQLDEHLARGDEQAFGIVMAALEGAGRSGAGSRELLGGHMGNGHGR